MKGKLVIFYEKLSGKMEEIDEMRQKKKRKPKNKSVNQLEIDQLVGLFC